MMKRLLIIAFTLILLFDYTYAYKKETFMVEMVDGIKLYTIVFSPVQTDDFPLPVILVRTPYNAVSNAKEYDKHIKELTETDRYIVVMQDIRGTYNSEGYYRAFLDDGWGDNKDGLQTINWIAKQNWCNGKIGMYGVSALAITQYLAAATNPPNLVCCFPSVGCWNLYDFAYQGGEFRQLDVLFWLMANAPADMMDTVKKYYNYSDMWEDLNCETRLDYIKVPMLHLGGWYDMFSPDALKAFYSLQYNGSEGARGKQKVVVGPWTHLTLGQSNSGDIQFPDNAIMSPEELAWNWFDYYLKGINNNIIDSYPNISLYLMGPVDKTGDWNKWLTFEEWPFTDTDTLTFYPIFPDSLGFENSVDDSASFEFDPSNPVSTKGGNNLMAFAMGAGPVDQATLMNRSDVLVFQSPSFVKPYDIFGNIKLKVFASSDRYDTDITAKLVDIYPDGRKILITDGIAMARHRESMSSEKFLEPFEPFEIMVDLNYTAYTIAPGHKLGLAISSSNFPKYAVNPNTPTSVHQSQELLKATNTIYSGINYPTVLVVPIRKTGFSSIQSPNEENEFVFNLYPNPCKNYANIEFYLNDNTNLKLSIINSIGVEIESFDYGYNEKGSYRKTVDLNQYLSGLYFFKLSSDNYTKCYKFIINK